MSGPVPTPPPDKPIKALSGGGDFTPAYDKNDEPAPKFAIEPVRGFRMWYLQSDGRIKSLSFPYFWTPGWNTFRCLKQVQYVDVAACRAKYHPATPYAHTEHCPIKAGGCEYPRLSCGCGFYAFYDRNLYNKSTGTAVVVGVIEGKGRCVIGPKGFRSAQARILGLHSFAGMKSLEFMKMQDRYQRFGGIRIFDDENEMLSVFPLTGTPT